MGRIIKGLLLFVLFMTAQEVFSDTSALKSYSEKCMRALRELDCQGVAVAIVREDQVVFSDGFGVCDQLSQKPVDARTFFAIGSITKGMVTTLLALFVEEGKLEWNDRVIDYLPEFTLFDQWVAKEMRVRDLLCHWVGLRDHAGDLLFLNLQHDQMIDRLVQMQPISGFRTSFAYQNLMYLVAGKLIQKVSGRSWEQLARERLFDPLGMRETLTEIKRVSQNHNLALGHVPLADGWHQVAWKDQVDFGPAGSVVSNVWEMAQWLRLLLNPGKEKEWPSWDLAAMQEPQVFLPLNPWVKRLYRSAQFMGCGMGWFSYDYFGYRIVEHSGNLPGLSAKLAMVPEKKIGVIVFCNQHESLLPHALVMEALDRLLETPSVDWIRRMALMSPKVHRSSRALQRVAVLSPDPGELVGSYDHNLIGKVEVVLEGGKLVLDYGRMAKGDLNHLGGDRYRVLWRQPIPRLIPGDLPIKVIRRGLGEVEGIRIENLATFSKRF